MRGHVQFRNAEFKFGRVRLRVRVRVQSLESPFDLLPNNENFSKNVIFIFLKIQFPRFGLSIIKTVTKLLSSYDSIVVYRLYIFTYSHIQPSHTDMAPTDTSEQELNADDLRIILCKYFKNKRNFTNVTLNFIIIKNKGLPFNVMDYPEILD